MMDIDRNVFIKDVASILADHALKVLLTALGLLENKSSTSIIKCLEMLPAKKAAAHVT